MAKRNIGDEVSGVELPRCLHQLSASCGFPGAAVEVYRSNGDSVIPEDAAAVHPRSGVVAVIDGVSEFYSDAFPRRLFGGKSGGRIVAEIIREVIETTSCFGSLRDLVAIANRRVRSQLGRLGYPVNSAERLPGAAAALIRLDAKRRCLEMISWGDTMVVWQTRTGHFGATRNETRGHDQQMKQVVLPLARRFQGNQRQIWDAYLPVARTFRHHRINRPEVPNHFALLNGQNGFLAALGPQPPSVPLRLLSQVIIFSDGCFPLEQAIAPVDLAKQVCAICDRDGLEGLVQEHYQMLRHDAGYAHTRLPEATAVRICLESSAC